MIFAYNEMIPVHFKLHKRGTNNFRRTLPILQFLGLRIFIFLLSTTLMASCQIQNKSKNEEKKVKIACVGDSITYGYGIKNREQYSYPSQLNKILGDSYEVKNFGVSGRTVLKRGDFPYWAEKAYEQAINYNPDIVVIKLGTNDSKFHNWKYRDQFISDYTEMIRSFKDLPVQPEIYICLPVPLYYAGQDINDSVITGQVIPRIDSIGEVLSIPVIDLYQPLSGHPQHFPDGIHPNADGARIIAQTVASFVTGP